MTAPIAVPQAPDPMIAALASDIGPLICTGAPDGMDAQAFSAALLLRGGLGMFVARDATRQFRVRGAVFRAGFAHSAPAGLG